MDIYVKYILQGDNPYQIILTSGEGYQPSAEELRRLEEIDDRLRAILPVEDFHSIASTTPRDKASQQVAIRSLLF